MIEAGKYPSSAPAARRRRLAIVLLLVGSLAVAGVAVAQQLPRGGDGELPGRTWEAAEAAAAAVELRLGDLDDPLRLRVELGPLSAEERREIRAAETAPRASFLKRVRIGIHRGTGTPGPARRLFPRWRAVPGGRAASVLFRSPQAVAVRVAIRFAALPEGAEAVFFAPGGAAEERYGPYAAATLRSHVDDEGAPLPFWSPVLPGETAGLELFVPEAATAEPVLELVQVGHLFRSPVGAWTAAASGACNVDLACSPEWKRLGRSVARIVIRGQFLCTGQLLNTTNEDDAGRLFLTAAHCVAGRPAASSLAFFWFYRHARCDAGREKGRQTAGGARLLAKTGVVGERPAATDHTLVRLEREPPAGVTLAGWSVRESRRLRRDPVTTVHHPAGDLKKISTGDARGRYNLFQGIDRAAPRTHHRTFWRTGTTEGGSSGSGLYVGESWPDQYLVGVLSGGFASCRTPDEPDFYGVFHRAYRKLRRFLE